MSKYNSLLLGVNIDHVATLRQARGTTRYPDPVQAAIAAEEGGADGITLHLREDRRHIQERDVLLLKDILQTRMNLELAVTPEMLQFAEQVEPAHVCLVPEKRQELTTEGGLNVAGQMDLIGQACHQLADLGAEVSLFIDPDPEQIKAAAQLEVPTIEIHTGQYAEAATPAERTLQLNRIKESVACGLSYGLTVNVGHGLHYHNVEPIAAIPGLNEFNIGHSIIARALFVGMKEAVKEMKTLLRQASQQ